LVVVIKAGNDGPTLTVDEVPSAPIMTGRVEVDVVVEAVADSAHWRFRRRRRSHLLEEDLAVRSCSRNAASRASSVSDLRDVPFLYARLISTESVRLGG
jgi:hypothetical protein